MFILFAGMRYEQCGGAMDIYFAGTTLKDCLDKVEEAVNLYSRYGDGGWWHIYDVFENEIVESSDD